MVPQDPCQAKWQVNESGRVWVVGCGVIQEVKGPITRIEEWDGVVEGWWWVVGGAIADGRGETV